jgi:hypothetical protein
VSRIRFALILALLVAGSFPATAAEDWARVPTPNAIDGHHNFLQGLDCVSPDDCWAVGHHNSPSGNRTLVLHWDGQRWSLVSSPNPAGHTITTLTAVGCANADLCWAVGFAYDGIDYRTLTLGWNGTAWTVATVEDTSTPGSDFLYDVSCASASDCWAVGQHLPGALGGGGAGRTLIHRWDGTAWSIVESPTSLPMQANRVVAVDCVAADDCWAVGSYGGAAADQTLTLRWDGQAWARVPSPSTSPEQANVLNGLTCVSAHDCWAVGVYAGQQSQALAMRWDGASWSLVPIPSSGPALANVLFDVSCSASNECWSVGYQREGTWLITLIERWDGERWEIVPSPNSSYGETNEIRRVECAAAACLTAGHAYQTGSIARTMVLHREGPPPMPAPKPGPPHIVDPPGDANGVNAQGTGEDLEVASDPASVAGADLVGVWFQTTYDTVVERDEAGDVRFIRHVATGLRMRVKTSAAVRPTLGPTLTYRVPVAIGPTCQAWLYFDVRGDLPGSVDRQGAGIQLQSGCGAATIPAGATLAFDGNSSAATYPLGAGVLAAGTRLGPWSKPSVRVIGGTSAQQLFTAPALDEASPMSEFVIGSDVPSDIDCDATPSEPACSG